MRILLVITGLGVGGAERQVIDLAESYIELGHQVKIAYLLKPVLLSPASSEIELIDLKLERTLFSVVRPFLRLKKVLDEFRPDVVHGHMVHANLFLRCARVFFKMQRLVCTAHSTNEGGRLRMMAYRVTSSLSEVFTNVSAEAVKEFEKKGAAKVNEMQVMFNGVDTRRFAFHESSRIAIHNELGLQNKKVILAVGRLYPEKDYPTLLKAMALVVKHEHRAHLVIVGTGTLKDELVLLCDQLGIADNVLFCGVRHDVAQVMSAADVFVLASTFEGFGLVVAEAMACSRVVVATDCGGVAEVLGDCGQLVRPGDSEALAVAIVESMNLDSKKTVQIGKEARLRIVEKFSLQSIVKRWIKIYEGQPSE